ncbi:hypothetical protein [Legionella quateirensis]|uniref:hypothetical protein n=1 Tax=Legionella quateirensis TaxID=45072 RepID=UPI000A7009E3|nr:hypothetical protein [Legionella quateirensis]
MEQSVIREAHAQHGTFLIGARFAGLPGLRAPHSIQVTFYIEIPCCAKMTYKKSGSKDKMVTKGL